MPCSLQLHAALACLLRQLRIIAAELQGDVVEPQPKAALGMGSRGGSKITRDDSRSAMRSAVVPGRMRLFSMLDRRCLTGKHLLSKS